jgi:hypothetical protein
MSDTLFNARLAGAKLVVGESDTPSFSVQAPALDNTLLAQGLQFSSLNVANLQALGGTTLGLERTNFVRPVDQPTIDKALINPSLVLQRFEPFSAVWITTRHGFRGLRDRAQLGRGSRPSLLERIGAFLREAESREQLRKDLGELVNADGFVPRQFGDEPPGPGQLVDPAVSGNGAPKHNEYSALFALSGVLADDVRLMERLRAGVAAVRQRRQNDLEAVQQRIAELQAELDAGRRELALREDRRLASLDDYVVGQRVLDQHWHEVEAAHRERRRVLESHQGLYAVRVRATPVGRPLPDPLPLRPARATDIVPGCPATPVPVAPALLPLMEAVLDIPVADWAALDAIEPLLPGREPLALMVALRQQKLQWKLAQPPAPVLGGLPALLQMAEANRQAVRPLLSQAFAPTSLLLAQAQARRVLALDDLLASPRPELREPAQALQARLQAAAGCLLARLRAMPALLRLQWGNAADADRLPVEDPSRWPGLAQAEADDFNGLRTLLELVAWWFAQLEGQASGAARTAMRNFVRGSLVLAAGDDPSQMLQGRVQSLPGRLAPGALMRVTLNREPAPGSLLNLLDAAQRPIGLLRVDDHDDGGTVARVLRVDAPEAVLGTGLRVVGAGRLG